MASRNSRSPAAEAVFRARLAEPGATHRRLPAVKDLQQQYEVAQGTAERAFALLREEGLVRSGQGRGHFTVPEDERPARPGS